MFVTSKQVRTCVTHFKGKYTWKCCQPKKGEFYMKPTGKKGVFEVLQAQQDFARNHYPIIDERYLDYMKKHHLTVPSI